MHNNPLQDINPFLFPPSLPSSALYLSQSLSSSRCISSSIHCYPRQRRGCGQFARRKFQVRVCNGQAIIDYVRLKYNFNFPLGRLDIHQEILLSSVPFVDVYTASGRCNLIIIPKSTNMGFEMLLWIARPTWV